MPWLATEAVHRLLRGVWQDADAWLVGHYMVMPDHIHLFAGAGGGEVPFDNWVRYWKPQFSKRHGNRAHRWQTDGWDRQMDTLEECEAHWEYVRNNPVRHGLVEGADDWPYQGMIHQLEW